MALTRKRIRQIMKVLLVILVADGIFLAYKYQEYRAATNVPGAKYSWSMSRNSVNAAIEKYIRKDFVLPINQANTIINPEALKTAQSKISSQENATHNIVFLKTHKTGSTTLQNIILRYAILHNLTVALPSYRASFFWPNTFSSQLFVKSRPGVKQFNILAHHAVYNRQEMLKVMKANPTFMTILREPVALFRSAYEYYNMQKYCFNTTVDEIRDSPQFSTLSRGVCPMTQTPVRNLQAFDLGLSVRDMDNEDAISALINEIDLSMKLVLITERFNESLILLKKLFNWSMEDIVYFKQNAQIPKAQDYEGKEKADGADEAILQFNKADHLIYAHFNNRLDKQLSKEFTEDELKQELHDLQKLQARYQHHCIDQLASANSTFFMSRASRYAMFRPYGFHTLGYVLKTEALSDIHCRLMAIPELTLTHYLKATIPKH